MNNKEEIRNFSKDIWWDKVNFQWSWWNISYKENWKLFIKSSWYKINDIYLKNTLSEINIENFNRDIENEKILNEFKLSKIIERNNKSKFKSSIETGFHLLLKSKYIIHTHNVYVNVLLCMKDADILINKIFSNDIDLIWYYSPWYWLFKEIKKQKNHKKIIFLKNHGIILHGSNSFDELYKLLFSIEQKIKTYLWLKDYIDTWNSLKIEKHIFPDSIMFPDNNEIYSAHIYIESAIKNIWQKVNYLEKEKIEFIKNMDCEKYRKNLLTNI